MDVCLQPGGVQFGAQLFGTFGQFVLDSEGKVTQSKVEQFFVVQGGPIGRKRRVRHRDDLMVNYTGYLNAGIRFQVSGVV
jgi:hypothetical protein